MWQYIVYSLRIRRVEYRIAELPIFFIPVLLTISHVSELNSLIMWEGLTAFLFVFAFGDLLNCLADRELDAIYKPQLTEAVYGIGIRGVIAQAVLSAVGAITLTTHIAWLTGRWTLIAMVIIGLIVAWAYSVEPVRLKGRGLWQLLFYWLGLFVAPMIFAASLFVDFPSITVAIISAAFASVQTGVILVNTAEDFPEDLKMKVRTAIVAMGLRSGIRLAFWLTAAGSVLLMCSFCWLGSVGLSLPWRVAAVLPMFLAVCHCALSVGRLHTSLNKTNVDEEAIAMVKLAAKRVPVWMTSIAVTTLVAALSVSPVF